MRTRQRKRQRKRQTRRILDRRVCIEKGESVAFYL
jgi:hypothetical protein